MTLYLAVSATAVLNRLPKLDAVSFRILEVGKTAVRIGRCVHLHSNACGLELCHQSVQVADSKVDHPLLRGIADITGFFRKRCEARRPGLLSPHRVPCALRRHRHTEVVPVPLRQRLRLLGPEEEAADPRDSFLRCSRGRRLLLCMEDRRYMSSCVSAFYLRGAGGSPLPTRQRSNGTLPWRTRVRAPSFPLVSAKDILTLLLLTT